jgi:predicted amidohydrolase YtcJ
MPDDAPMSPTLVIRDARLPDRPVDVIVAGDRIAAVIDAGSAEASGVDVVDARGGTILPGFVDAHVHLVLAGTTLAQVDLAQCPSRAEFERRMVDRAASTAPDAWILGHGWLETDWQRAGRDGLPDASWLAACGERPAVCFKHDHHAVLVNDVVLAMLSDRLHTDPPGGTIVRGSDGRPTGLLLEAAAWQLVNPIIPKPSVAERRRTTIDATRHLASLGITAVGSMEYAEDVVDVLDAIREDLHVAVAVTMLDRELPIDDALMRLEALDRDDHVRLVGCKAFLDGTLGSRTAAMLADYADRPGERGMFVELAERGELHDWIAFVVRRGWNPSMHAIGDAAARLALDACDHADAIARDEGLELPRLRIEHCQTIDPADIARFAPPNRYASMQPTHMLDDGTTVERSLGPERFDAFFPFRAIHEAGGTLSFGSDWPIETPDPIEGIRVAVTGVDRHGRVVPGRDRTVSVDTAIKAYTTNARTALGLPAVEVAEGFPADLVILDRDPLTARWEDESTIPQVQATVRGGRTTFC